MLDAEINATVKVVKAGIRSLERMGERVQGVDALLEFEKELLGIAQMSTAIACDIDTRVTDRQALNSEEMNALHGAVGVMRKMARTLPPDDAARALALATQANEVAESLAVVILSALDIAKGAEPEGRPEWKTHDAPQTERAKPYE